MSTPSTSRRRRTGPWCGVRRRFGSVHDRAADRPGQPGRRRWRSRTRSTGTSSRSCSSSVSRSTCMPTVGGGDPVRPPLPADPHQHLVGGRPVRDLRAPVRACRRARLRRGDHQRLDLRLRRRAGRPATTAARPRPSACRWSAGPRSPIPTPTRASTPLPGHRPARRPRSRDAVEEGYRTQPAPAHGAAASDDVAPLVTVDQPGVVVEAVKLADDGRAT